MRPIRFKYFQPESVMLKTTAIFSTIVIVGMLIGVAQILGGA